MAGAEAPASSAPSEPRALYCSRPPSGRPLMRFYEFESRRIVERAGIPVTEYGFCKTAGEARRPRSGSAARR